MRILLTGANGMLGSNLIPELLSRGHQVRAFLLPNTSTDYLDSLPIEYQEGNILVPEDVINAIKGCDAVIHAAANTNIYPSRSNSVRKVNINGTKNIINAALKAKVKRAIFIGTANSFGFGSKSHPGNETCPYQSDKYGLDYMDSKYEAQKLVLKAVKENGLPAIMVNPTFMFGAHDSKPGSGKLILSIYNEKLPGYTMGGRNYIYVKDVTVAIANALTKGKIGECYIAGNTNLTYKEAFTKIAKVVGVQPPKIKFPEWLIEFYGMCGSLYGSIFNKKPNVSYPMARISEDEHYFSSKKAVKELDMPQTKIEIGILECFNWMKSHGYC